MYTAEINRRQPAFLLLLVDQSYSMSQAWDADGKSKADMLALTVNRLLGNAVLLCTKGDDRIHDYFEMGVIGYGGDITLALHGATPERPVLPISEVGRNPRRLDEVMRKVPDGAGGTVQLPLTMPVWVDPVTNGNTPMVQAFDAAEQVVSAWCGLHPTSFPPIVINITDGESTDGDPAPVAARLRSAHTVDGNALLFNVHLPALDPGKPHVPRHEVIFPNSTEALPDGSAARLFTMSSELPGPIAEAASSAGYAVRPGARGFLYNAQPTSVIDFLDIGTRAATPTGLKELTAANTSST
ncbi:vWA domain-containing protein [Actinosynnema sp. CA-248983]